MALIADYVFDLALAEFDTATTTLYLTNAEATNYAQASSTYKLGTKTSLSIGAPADRGSGGRKATVAAITDGVVDTSGTASHWAITKNGTTLMAAGQLTAPQVVTSGNAFTLAAFDINFPDAVNA